MRREVSLYILGVLVIAAAFLMVYNFGAGPTGHVVYGEYTDEVSCVDAGYFWQNITEQNCTTETTYPYVNETVDCEPCLEYEDLNGTQGECISWTSCANETAVETETCEDVVTGGECVGEGDELSVSISEPVGDDYASLSEVPLTFTIAGGTGTNLSCLYSINYAGGELMSNTSVECDVGENTASFGLGEKGGDNTLTLYVSDSSGSASASSPVFSFYIPEDEGSSSEGESSGGETSTETGEETVPDILAVTEISLGSVPAQDVEQGASRDLTLSIQNTGNLQVSSCSLTGDSSGWVSIATGSRDLQPGESSSYAFSVNVPEDAEAGAHSLALSVACAQTSKSTSVSVNVIQKKLDLNITDVRRARDDRVDVYYVLTELAGEDQEVEIFFSITDAAGTEVGNATQNRSLNANETDDFRTSISVDENLLPVNETTGEPLETDLTLSTNLNSEVYSTSVLEPIHLGPVTGGAIFGGAGAGSAIIVLIVLAIIVAMFFIARKMRRMKYR